MKWASFKSFACGSKGSLAALCGFAFLGAGVPAQAIEITESDLRSLPVCEVKKGIKATYRFGLLDGAEKMNGKYYVKISKEDTAPLMTSKKQLEFMAMHECAHAKLGHVEADIEEQFNMSDEDAHRNELDADCDAAKSLKKLRAYGLEDIKEASAFLVHSGHTHPDGQKRIDRVIKCYLGGQ